MESRACVTENMIAAFADGALTPRASDAFDAHLAECAACRALVRELPAARAPAASSTGDDGRERATILRPGDTFGRYTITAWLGRGGMGQVYRARDALLARDLALKLLSPDGEIADAGARLLREARAAATLAHPNVVTIFDVGEHDGVRYIAMELVVGQTLRARLARGPLPMRLVEELLLGVARALAAAHAWGIVHRDIKPENVMLRDDGVVKVLDFGLARRTDDPASLPGVAPDLATLTQNGGCIGTPGYMSPEQLRGDALDGRSDQFSWGVLAYELFSGHLPWVDARGPVFVLHAMLNAEAAPLPARTGELPASIQAAVTRALRIAREQRFDSMNDIVAALEEAKDVARPSRGPAMGAVSSDEKTGLLARAGRALFALALVVLVVVAVHARERPSRGPRSPPTGARESADPKRQEAFREGIRAVHEGSLRDARAGFARAAASEPTRARARLYAALFARDFDTAFRVDLQTATGARAELDERERALLDAIAPWGHAPPDWSLAEARLSELARHFPLDGDVRFALGRGRFKIEDLRGAIAAYEDALRVDPSYGVARAELALCQLYLDDQDAARGTLDACMRDAPASTSCLYYATVTATLDGRCDDAERSARRYLALDRDNVSIHRLLADARLSCGGSLAEVSAILDGSVARAPEAARPVARLRNETALALLRGDLRAADDAATRWEALVTTSPDEVDHVDPAVARIEIALESRSAELGAIADRFLHGLLAWAHDDFQGRSDFIPLTAKVRAGAMTLHAFRARRDAVVAEERATIAHAGSGDLGVLWLSAFAQPAYTEGDARDALARLPEYAPLPSRLNRDLDLEEALGRTYLLAGDLDRATSSLDRAGRMNQRLLHPIEAIWVDVDRGALLEARRDRAGACAAYARVEERWPVSTLSGSRARARATALRCVRSP